MELCADIWEKSPALNKNKWRDLFACSNNSNNSENSGLLMEIGCGKGGFIRKKAAAEPFSSFVAVEKYVEVFVTALETVSAESLKNVKMVHGDALSALESFGDGELDGIYINFCDPWLKHRHAHRRLTHRKYLEAYKRAVKKGGFIKFKTDNRPLFDFSVNEAIAANLETAYISYDLHNDANITDNICTEYEKLFSEKGMSIHYLHLICI